MVAPLSVTGNSGNGSGTGAGEPVANVEAVALTDAGFSAPMGTLVSAPDASSVSTGSATSASPPGPPGNGPTGNGGRKPPPTGTPENLLKILRELRVEVQSLQETLAAIRAGEANLDTYKPFIAKTCDDIRVVTTILATVDNPENSDGIRLILNTWEQMEASPIISPQPGAPALPAQEQVQNLTLLDAKCKKLTYEIGLVTIPPRLQSWLDKGIPGYYVPFHQVFEDELPEREDRVRVLNFLAWAPSTLKGGLIDVSSGLIYRYSTDTWRQWLSLLGLILGLAASFFLVVASANAFWVGLDGWPIEREHLPLLIAGWLSVLAGIIVHMLVGLTKRVQSQVSLPPVLAPVRILARLNANLGPMLLKIALALVGLYGLAFANGIDALTVFSAFLAGYSLDSVVELVGLAADKGSASQIAGLKKGLGVTTE